MTTAEADFESLSVDEANARLHRALAKLDAERFRPSVKPPAARHGHTDRTKRRLAASMFQRRRAEALLADPSPTARIRLAAGLTQKRAADKAILAEKTWCRAEANIDAMSRSTQRRVARALNVEVADLR